MIATEVPTLRGTRVALRPATVDDAAHLVRWSADPDFSWYQWGRRAGRFDEQTARDWIDRFAGDPNAALFVLEHGGLGGEQQGRAIGFANYRDLRPKPKSAEVGIGIGEKALWGKGLGREALTLLVRHLLEDLGLHRISLSVLAFNDRAIASYKAVGFEVEGVERDAVMTDRGDWVDDVRMALLSGRGRPAFDPVPVTLAGRHVRLEPLRVEHAEALCAAGDEDDIWRHIPPRPVGIDGYEAYIRRALDAQIVGAQLPFVVKRPDGEIVGTTRYAHIDRADRSLEIGYTFYGRGARRTGVNTEAKYLLLRHAFETLGAIRVWLQTDVRNERSQQAIARIGATREAETRNERIRPDGSYRTSVVFSVIESEWPGTKRHLEALLAR